MKRITSLIALVLIGFPAISVSPAAAHDIKISSTGGLLANCTYQSDDQSEIEFHTGLCLGFIKAVMNMHPTAEKTFCIPKDWDNGDLIRFVRDALYRLPPDMMNTPSHMVVGAAFDVGLPCVQR